MSLETQIANLVTSANALTGEVSNKMGSLDARIDGFINNWGINGYTTLEVGPGKPFPTIQAAWDSLIGKTLKADVKIKVADGVHTAKLIYLAHQPYARRIRIEGNVDNPDACVIRWTADANKYSHGFIADGVRGVNISGFRMEGSATATHWTLQHLMAINGAWVTCDPGTNKFVGGGRGLEATSNSIINCRDCTIDGVVNAVIASQDGFVYAEGTNILGAGRSTVFSRPDGGSERAYGVRVFSQGTVFCQGSTANNVYIGFGAYNALIHATSAQVTNADTGFYATEITVIRADGAAKALNCDNGYQATFSAQIVAVTAVAESCTTGFYAETSGRIVANDSAVKHCTTGYAAYSFASIEAYNTTANAVNTTTMYSPANHAVLGNSSAMIRRN